MGSGFPDLQRLKVYQYEYEEVVAWWSLLPCLSLMFQMCCVCASVGEYGRTDVHCYLGELVVYNGMAAGVGRISEMACSRLVPSQLLDRMQRDYMAARAAYRGDLSN